MKFLMHRYFSTYVSYEIEANSEDEALDKRNIQSFF